MAEASDKVNIGIDMETDGNSVKTDDVFIDAKDKPCVKPRRKRVRARESNDSIDSNTSIKQHEEGEYEGGVVEESGDEEGIEGDDKQHVSEGAHITTSEKHFLTMSEMKKDFSQLQKEMTELRRTNEAFTAEFQTTVTKAVIEVVSSLKQNWMDEVLGIVKVKTDNFDSVAEDLENVKWDVRELKRADPVTQAAGVVGEETNKRMEMVEDKVVDLEARSRRNNIIIHGVQEQRDEQCLWLAHDVIEQDFQIKDWVVIERAHRIGKKKAWATRPRPLIIRFLDYNDKMKVKSARKTLPSHISVTDDLPFAIRMAQKQLVPRLNAAKQHTNNCYIRFPATLVVDGYDVQTVKPVTDPTKAQNIRHNNHDNNNSSRHYVTAETGLRGHWNSDASVQQPGHRDNKRTERSHRRDTHDIREYRNTTNNRHTNNIPIHTTESEHEEGEWSEGSQHGDQQLDYGDRHDLHRRVDRATQQGASNNTTGRRGGVTQRGRGFTQPPWNSDRQGYFYRKQ